jgi:hypothetical protein
VPTKNKKKAKIIRDDQRMKEEEIENIQKDRENDKNIWHHVWEMCKDVTARTQADNEDIEMLEKAAPKRTKKNHNRYTSPIKEEVKMKQQVENRDTTRLRSILIRLAQDRS